MPYLCFPFYNPPSGYRRAQVKVHPKRNYVKYSTVVNVFRSQCIGFPAMKTLNLILILHQDLSHTPLCEQGPKNHIAFHCQSPRWGGGPRFSAEHVAREGLQQSSHIIKMCETLSGPPSYCPSNQRCLLLLNCLINMEGHSQRTKHPFWLREMSMYFPGSLNFLNVQQCYIHTHI